MEEILASANLSNTKSIHIATLARQTVIDAGVEHLGFNGYFIFETISYDNVSSLNILGKIASLEAAFQVIDLWNHSANPVG